MYQTPILVLKIPKIQKTKKGAQPFMKLTPGCLVVNLVLLFSCELGTKIKIISLINFMLYILFWWECPFGDELVVVKACLREHITKQFHLNAH